MLRLEPLELAHQRVELGVGDLRRVEDVVALFVMANQAAELVDARAVQTACAVSVCPRRRAGADVYRSRETT